MTKKPNNHCPKCGGGIIWLQDIGRNNGEPWRGCRNWIACDYVEVALIPRIFSAERKP